MGPALQLIRLLIPEASSRRIKLTAIAKIFDAGTHY
jgi:hypothetical protein